MISIKKFPRQSVLFSRRRGILSVNCKCKKCKTVANISDLYDLRVDTGTWYTNNLIGAPIEFKYVCPYCGEDVPLSYLKNVKVCNHMKFTMVNIGKFKEFAHHCRELMTFHSINPTPVDKCHVTRILLLSKDYGFHIPEEVQEEIDYICMVWDRDREIEKDDFDRY